MHECMRTSALRLPATSTSLTHDFFMTTTHTHSLQHWKITSEHALPYYITTALSHNSQRDGLMLSLMTSIKLVYISKKPDRIFNNRRDKNRHAICHNSWGNTIWQIYRGGISPQLTWEEFRNGINCRVLLLWPQLKAETSTRNMSQARRCVPVFNIFTKCKVL